jgi:replicative DNA helicase
MVEQKELYIIKLRKQIEEQHDNFCLRLDEKEKYYTGIIAEKERLINKMMDGEREIVHNSYLRNEENAKRIEKLQDQIFKITESLILAKA